MLSSLYYVRLGSRGVRSWQRLSRGSLNSVRSCRCLTTTRHFHQEDETLMSNVTKKTSLASNISSESEYLPKGDSPAVDKRGTIDVIPKVLEEFFHKARCEGCGTVFQSEERQKPGFVIAAKNPSLQDAQNDVNSLKPVLCERCFNIKNYNKGSQVLVSPVEVCEFLGHIAQRKALILYVVDILDLPGSMVPGLLDIIGPTNRIIVVANKLDKLPAEGKATAQYEKLHSYVRDQCHQHGLKQANIKDVCLISAKKGFGIPQLVNQILKHWHKMGDIYLVGSNNTGKTSLFNTLIDLTNVHKNSDMLHRAVVSRLPGTTLSLLRMPCSYWKLTKLKYRLLEGTEKYKQALAAKEEYDIDPEIIDKEETSYKDLKSVRKTLATTESQESKIDIIKPEIVSSIPEEKQQFWLYDTPGILNQNQVTNYLTMEELKLLHSNLSIIPKTYVLKPGQAFFLGGLARIDYNNITRMPRQHEAPDTETLTEANKSVYFTIFSSPNLPIHVLNIDKATEFYNKRAGQDLLKVPSGGSNRMESFPALQGHDFNVTGIGWKESAADIVLSDIGWVSVTAGQKADVQITAYTPNAVGMVLREPALLPNSVKQKGKRGVRYQGHIDYSGYETPRKSNPPLIDFLSEGQQGVYQWYREVKRKIKQQEALIKAEKMMKVIEKSLTEGDNFRRDRVSGRDKRRQKTDLIK